MSYKFDMTKHGVAEKGPTNKAQTVGKSSSPDVVKRVFDPAKTDIIESRVVYEEIPLTKIVPRSINQYSQGRIDKLAKSIENTGNRLIHPIVVARISDLQLVKDSEILKKFEEQGKDISGYEYVLVAGERRYRAFQMLREKKAKELKSSKKFENNPFDTITANVLSKSEFVNCEQAFYEDSNLMSRQLTPVEAILHVKDAVDAIKTDEEKIEALKEYYPVKHPDKALPDNEAKMVRLFKQDEYLSYYLSTELGIEGWSESTIKTYASIVKNCDPYVIDSIVEESFSARAARDLPKLDPDTQKKLVDVYKVCATSESKDFTPYYNAVELAKNPNGSSKSKSRIDYIDARKNLVSYKQKLENEIFELQQIHDCLGSSYQEVTAPILKDLNKLLKNVNESIPKLYKQKK